VFDQALQAGDTSLAARSATLDEGADFDEAGMSEQREVPK
jgi:hypothetical protein